MICTVGPALQGRKRTKLNKRLDERKNKPTTTRIFTHFAQLVNKFAPQTSTGQYLKETCELNVQNECDSRGRERRADRPTKRPSDTTHTQTQSSKAHGKGWPNVSTQLEVKTMCFEGDAENGNPCWESAGLQRIEGQTVQET